MRSFADARRIAKLIVAPLTGATLGLLPPLLPLPGSPNPVLPGGPQSGSAPGVRISTSGNHSERFRLLPIGRRSHGAQRVVMSLGPGKLPTLMSGDRLGVTAEVQVSTTCVEPASHCIGRRYRFSPRVSARLVLAAGPHRTRGSGAEPISKRRTLRCSQSRPNRNHHCVIVFKNAGTQIGSTGALPCEPSKCHVNLAMRAYHRRSRGRDALVIGGDRPGHRVVQDKGRLNVVLARGDASATATSRRTRDVVSRGLPLDQPGPGGQQVVASIRLKKLDKGDRLVVFARQVATLRGLGANAFVGSELILAAHHRATKTGVLARRTGILSGRISEFNGFNCTLGRSAFESPCRTEKVGVTRIKRKAAEAGRRKPMFLNLVSRAQPIGGEPAKGKRVRVRRAMVKLVRYSGR